MSCALALAASLALADFYGAGPATQAAVQVKLEAENPLAAEPLYADIISRARRLSGDVAAWRATPGLKQAASPATLAGFEHFRGEAEALSTLDMKGHVDLAARGTDGDLKCILKGLSQDIPVKVQAVLDARTGADQDMALDDLAYLLEDNVEVITTPAKVQSTAVVAPKP